MDNDDESGFNLKLSSSTFEINVWLRADEIERFESVRTARWDDHGSVQIGTVLGSPAFWSTSEEMGISLLAGHDAETWAVGATLPLGLLDEIIAELARSLRDD